MFLVIFTFSTAPVQDGAEHGPCTASKQRVAGSSRTTTSFLGGAEPCPSQYETATSSSVVAGEAALVNRLAAAGRRGAASCREGKNEVADCTQRLEPWSSCHGSAHGRMRILKRCLFGASMRGLSKARRDEEASCLDGERGLSKSYCRSLEW